MRTTAWTGFLWRAAVKKKNVQKPEYNYQEIWYFLPGNGCFSRLQQPTKFKHNHVIGGRLMTGYATQPEAVIGHCLPACPRAGPASSLRLMTSAPGTGCIRAALFGHKDEHAFSNSAWHLHNKLTWVESRGHGVDAQAPAAHFHPSLIGHVGRGVVLRVRVPLVNNLRERREEKQY